MVKKIKAAAENKEENGQLASAIRESAEKIWLAGLGAFAKARKEPTKAFETLVREGLNLQSRTKAMAEERIGDMSGKVNEVKSQISSRANESWDKLEQVFEDRVSRALERLGVPTRKDVQALVARIDDLTSAVESVGGKVPARGATARKGASKAGAAKGKAAKAPAKSKSPAGAKASAKSSAKAAAPKKAGSAAKGGSAKPARVRNGLGRPADASGAAEAAAPARTRMPRARKATAVAPEQAAAAPAAE
jgi:poly(hydroxyalkanoate) granule-associated protein